MCLLFLCSLLFVVVIPTTVLAFSLRVVTTHLVHRLMLLPPGAAGTPDDGHLQASLRGSRGLSSAGALSAGPIQMFLDVVLSSGTRGQLFPQSAFGEAWCEQVVWAEPGVRAQPRKDGNLLAGP